MPLAGKTINERFAARINATPDSPAFWTKRDGKWTATSWREFGRLSHAFAAGLLEAGHGRGEPIAILGDTREEWSICDMGGLAIGATVVGVYQTLTTEQAAYVVEHCDATTLVVQDAAQLEKMRSAKSGLPKIQRIVVWDPDGAADDERVISYADIIAKGSELVAADTDRIWKMAFEVQPEDPAVTIYTSGTTGPPKGAVLSHRNICFKMEVLEELLPASPSDSSFAFLPMAHVAERVVGAMTRIQIGYGAYYAQSLATIIQDVGETKPTIFGSVPRIFEKAYAKIMAGIQESSGVKGSLAKWAVGMARAKSKAGEGQTGKGLNPIQSIQYAIADKLVLSKVRAVFGGRVRFFISGAAPIAFEILEFFDGAGLTTYEVYGMTESSALITANRPGALRLGTVGKPIPRVEVMIAEDGEILCRGENVFLGYHKNEEATAETIDDDGWLHTGDVGAFDQDGFVSITGRKKEIAITAGGKNISPANIENLIKQSPIVSQALVHADRRKFPSALITIDPEAAPEWAKANGATTDMSRFADDPKVKEHLEAHIASVNSELSPVEQVKAWKVLDEDFTVENGLATPTMKIKRSEIEKRYGSLLDAFYE
ncbi:MAG: AMP-dependent synthetase/ligase [Actinomycetota bacterium]